MNNILLQSHYVSVVFLFVLYSKGNFVPSWTNKKLSESYVAKSLVGMILSHGGLRSEVAGE